MTTYNVRCVWDDGAWVVNTVPRVPGVHTQCKRLDLVAQYLAEAAHLMTGEAKEEVEIGNMEIVGGDAVRAAARAKKLREKAAALVAEAEAAAQSTVPMLRDAGFSIRDVGTLTGMSHGRAQQIAKPQRRRQSTVT